MAFVSIGDVDVGDEMIRRGLAIAERRCPCDRLDEYIRLMRGAQAGKMGMWKDERKQR